MTSEKNLKAYRKWAEDTKFHSTEILDDLFSVYPNARIPKDSSWYAIVNNFEEFCWCVEKLDSYESLLENNIIKQVYIKEGDDDVDNDYECFVHEITDTSEQEEIYQLKYNEFFDHDQQVQLTKRTIEKDPYRKIIVPVNEIQYPCLFNYVFDHGFDRVSKSFKVNGTILQPLHGMEPRKTPIKIHFISIG